MANTEIKMSGYSITTDKSKLDLTMIHEYLSNRAYWCLNVPYDTVKKSIENSLNFGVFYKDKQIGFARVVSDYSTVAYLGDVFIHEDYRGKGLSKWLMKTVTDYPDLQGLRRWILLTRDAHGLYKQFGWTEIESPQKWMEKYNKNVYQS